MVNVEKVYHALLANGIDFFTGVPDSLLKDICAYITDHTFKEQHVIAANEGTAVSIAAGHYLASGNLSLVYMQNSGIGNAVNPLLSLADKKVYSLPIILMIGWRGEPGVKDEPQHEKQGEVTLDLLNTMQIPFVILNAEEDKALRQIHDIIISAKDKSIPHAIIIRKNIFGKYKLLNEQKNDCPLSREEALKLVVDYLEATDLVVSTTGKLSRELFEYREAEGEGHECDFLTVGSMGHSSSIALGIALANSERRVFCLDGDGAFIMHMGAIGNIGYLSPKNYFHILFNNGSHESVGGQPTIGFQLDIPAIAKACGYRTVFSLTTKDEIKEILQQTKIMEGPVLIELKVKVASRDDLGRPTTTPLENKFHFMEFLKNK